MRGVFSSYRAGSDRLKCAYDEENRSACFVTFVRDFPPPTPTVSIEEAGRGAVRASRGCNLDLARVFLVCLARETVAERFHARNFAGWAVVWKLNPNRSIKWTATGNRPRGVRLLLARDVAARRVSPEHRTPQRKSTVVEVLGCDARTHVARVAGCVGECRGSRWSDLIFALC